VSLSLGDRTVGSGPTLIVAEIGSNHDGDLERALALIDAAAAAGADAVQFHSFRAAHAGAVHDRDAARELRTEWHARLRERAAARGRIFLATPFDEERATLLAALGVPAFPVASCDLERTPLLRAVGGFGRTGAARRGRCRQRRDRRRARRDRGGRRRAAASGRRRARDRAERQRRRRAARCRAARRAPCVPRRLERPPGDAGARAGAVARGACLVVKPFSDDRTRRGPEHATALDPAAFAAMVAAIRELEPALAEPRMRRGPLPAGRPAVERVGRMR
jgi:hypothetical protein